SVFIGDDLHGRLSTDCGGLSGFSFVCLLFDDPFDPWCLRDRELIPNYSLEQGWTYRGRSGRLRFCQTDPTHVELELLNVLLSFPSRLVQQWALSFLTYGIGVLDLMFKPFDFLVEFGLRLQVIHSLQSGAFCICDPDVLVELFI